MSRRKLGKRPNPGGVRDGNNQNHKEQNQEDKIKQNEIRDKRSHRKCLECLLAIGDGFIGLLGYVEKKGR